MNASMPHNTSATKHTNKHVPISVTQHLEHKSLDIKKYHGLTSASIQYQYSIDTVSIQYQYVLILLTYVNHVKIQGTVHDVLRNAWVVKQSFRMTVAWPLGIIRFPPQDMAQNIHVMWLKQS